MGNFKASDFLSVIPDTRGNISKIAEKVGCSRPTVYKAMKDWSTVADAIKEEKERFKDQMETTIEQKCLDGDTTMMIFYAKTQMRDRGYAEKSEMDITSGGKPIKGYVAVSPDDWDNDADNGSV